MRNSSSFMRRVALSHSGGIRILETREFVEVNVFCGYMSDQCVKILEVIVVGVNLNGVGHAFEVGSPLLKGFNDG